MDLYKLKTFKTVALFLNFNQAAKSLNCAQSTVSAQIKSLEDEIGELLFRRIKKRVALTAAGEKMLGYADKLLSIEEEAIADLSGKREPRGTLSLMVPEAVASSYLPNLLGDFMDDCPAVNFDISNCSESCLENDLQTGSVDLAFVFSDTIHSSTLNSEKILSTRLLMAAAPEHPLAGKKTIDTSDLQSQTIFLLKAGCGYGLRFRQMLNTNIIKPASVLELTSVEAIKKCTGRGLGLAILPEPNIRKEIRGKRLVELNWTEAAGTTLLMVWHKDKKVSKILGRFMDLARQIKRNRDITASMPKAQ